MMADWLAASASPEEIPAQKRLPPGLASRAAAHKHIEVI